MSPSTVLIDVDGTLVDSNAFHAAAWSEASKRLGFEKPVEFFLPLIGMGGDRVIPLVSSELNDEDGLGKAMTEHRKEIFRARYLPLLKPTPGAKALVERLHGDGLRCVIASSASAEELDDLLRVVGIEHVVDVKTTTDDAAESKPAGDIIEAALRKAGRLAREAVMLGDTPHDVTAARNAGVSTIAFRCGGWGDGDLNEAAAIYDDPADLLAQLATSPLRSR